MKEFKLIGLQLSCKTTNQNGQSEKDCGALWQTFEVQEIASRIPNKTTDAIYAVYFGYESDENGSFSYFIGCPVETDTQTPEGLQELVIPKQQYRKETAVGQMPGCMHEAWKRIWSAGMRRKFGYDFEVYDERSSDWARATVDIYVSVTE